jgi:hypothetical protein
MKKMFKVGDRVKCVDTTGSFDKYPLIKNKIYTVRCILNNGCIVVKSNSKLGVWDSIWDPDKFILYESVLVRKVERCLNIK